MHVPRVFCGVAGCLTQLQLHLLHSCIFFPLAFCLTLLCSNVEHGLFSIIYAHMQHTQQQLQHINEVRVVQQLANQFCILLVIC